jgi:hypothetical protein
MNIKLADGREVVAGACCVGKAWGIPLPPSQLKELTARYGQIVYLLAVP